MFHSSTCAFLSDFLQRTSCVSHGNFCVRHNVCMNQTDARLRGIAASQITLIKIEAVLTNLRDTLLVHFSVEHCPCYSARVLALQEKGFGFAILETKDLAVTSNVELALDFQD